MRIGEQTHHNDGVVGYWKEELQELGALRYTITATTNIISEDIKSYQDEPLHLAQSLSGQPNSYPIDRPGRSACHNRSTARQTDSSPKRSVHASLKKNQYLLFINTYTDARPQGNAPPA